MIGLAWLTFVIAGVCFSHRMARLQNLRFSDRHRPPGAWWTW